MPHSTSQNTLFSAPYTHSGVQALIQWLMDTQGIGQFELSKRSGLSPATVYADPEQDRKDDHPAPTSIDHLFPCSRCWCSGVFRLGEVLLFHHSGI